MPKTVGVRREDLSKTGEKRVAITPNTASSLLSANHRVLVQPGIHYHSGENKRAFSDQKYVDAGATIQEDIRDADIIFGLKEVEIDSLIPSKTYLFFSHTHKGQVKNRPLLKALMEKKITMIDYELIVDEQNTRLVTAFTYFAGYAGMTDSLWTLGKRWNMRGVDSAFTQIPQSIEREDLPKIREDITAAGKHIAKHGTPASQPPVIITILGRGKTSAGSKSMLEHLPTEYITFDQLEDVYQNGDRRKVYVLVIGIRNMFRPKPGFEHLVEGKSKKEFNRAYNSQPDHFRSNLDRVIPFTTILMNCILWSPEFPRLLTREETNDWWNPGKTLEVIGDITCDPEGSIQFSKETWITNPVFIYNPETRTSTDGFEGDGIAVMAVTNLPCEFPGDASTQFSSELFDLIHDLVNADHDAASLEKAGFPEPMRKATILWKGELTEEYRYMEEFVG